MDCVDLVQNASMGFKGLASEGSRDYYVRKSMHCILVYTDINECVNNNGGCSDGCNNTEGSYYCTCSSGYELSGDNVTCIGESKLILLHLRF